MRNFWGLSTKFFSKNLFQIFYIVQLYIVVGVSNGRDSPTNRDLDETNMKLTCNQAYSNWSLETDTTSYTFEANFGQLGSQINIRRWGE